MKTTMKKVQISVAGVLLFLLILLGFGSQGAEAVFTKSLSTNLTLELLLEKLPSRELSERGFSAKDMALYNKMEREGKLIKPDSFYRYRLFVLDGLERKCEEVWSKSFDKYDKGPHFPAPVAFLDAVLVHSNLFVCYKTYSKLLVERFQLASPARRSVDESSAATLFRDTTAFGWIANSA